jgi:thiamine transport system substrate-binding protein
VVPSKTFLMSPSEVAKSRKTWIDEWLKATGTN